jgi:hypothetical protein
VRSRAVVERFATLDHCGGTGPRPALASGIALARRGSLAYADGVRHPAAGEILLSGSTFGADDALR